MLVHKGGHSIDHWAEDCRDVTKAGVGRICTKNGSYCEKKLELSEDLTIAPL